MKLVLVTPRVSEKAYRLVTSQNTYVFDVPMSANKNEIKAAVEAQFDGTKVDACSKRQVDTLQPRQKSLPGHNLAPGQQKSLRYTQRRQNQSI